MTLSLPRLALWWALGLFLADAYQRVIDLSRLAQWPPLLAGLAALAGGAALGRVRPVPAPHTRLVLAGGMLLYCALGPWLRTHPWLAVTAVLLCALAVSLTASALWHSPGKGDPVGVLTAGFLVGKVLAVCHWNGVTLSMVAAFAFHESVYSNWRLISHSIGLCTTEQQQSFASTSNSRDDAFVYSKRELLKCYHALRTSMSAQVPAELETLGLEKANMLPNNTIRGAIAPLEDANEPWQQVKGRQAFNGSAINVPSSAPDPRRSNSGDRQMHSSHGKPYRGS